MYDGYLSEHFVLQHEFGVNPGELEGQEFVTYIRNMTLAAHTELSEFLQELRCWKPWGGQEARRPDWEVRDHMVEELIDVMHFCANLLLALRVTDTEVESVDRMKMQENVRRQRALRSSHHSSPEGE